MKTQIQKIEDRTAKNNQEYKSVTTSNGAMSCFDDKIWGKLDKALGKEADVEVIESKGFKNIIGINDIGEKYTHTEEAVKDTQMLSASDKYTAARNSKDTSMYTSYAKDIFIQLTITDDDSTLKKDLMTHAVELVKQAREAFE